jgi:hypothetical protein
MYFATPSGNFSEKDGVETVVTHPVNVSASANHCFLCAFCAFSWPTASSAFIAAISSSEG